MIQSTWRLTGSGKTVEPMSMQRLPPVGEGERKGYPRVWRLQEKSYCKKFVRGWTSINKGGDTQPFRMFTTRLDPHNKEVKTEC